MLLKCNLAKVMSANGRGLDGLLEHGLITVSGLGSPPWRRESTIMTVMRKGQSGWGLPLLIRVGAGIMEWEWGAHMHLSTLACVCVSGCILLLLFTGENFTGVTRYALYPGSTQYYNHRTKLLYRLKHSLQMCPKLVLVLYILYWYACDIRPGYYSYGIHFNILKHNVGA